MLLNITTLVLLFLSLAYIFLRGLPFHNPGIGCYSVETIQWRGVFGYWLKYICVYGFPTDFRYRQP